MLKKLLILAICLFLAACMCSCTDIEIHGIENFDQETCSVGLTKNLLPSASFLENYDYLTSDYYYFDECDMVWAYAKAVVVLTYEEDTYIEAKAFCVEKFDVCEKHQYTCGQYTFYEIMNCSYLDLDDSGASVCEFPKHFNMFAFNDESCSLVFLGYYDGDPESQGRVLAINDFGSFLEDTYPEIFYAIEVGASS